MMFVVSSTKRDISSWRSLCSNSVNYYAMGQGELETTRRDTITSTALDEFKWVENFWVQVYSVIYFHYEHMVVFLLTWVCKGAPDTFALS